MLLAVAITALVTVAIFEAVSLAVSACQWFLSHRPFLGRWVCLSCSRPGEGGAGGMSPEQSHLYRTSQGRLLSSPLPARCTADPESAGEVT